MKFIPEEQLAAYFRGELNEPERREVEAWLAASEKHRKAYRQLCRVLWWSRWGVKEQRIDAAAAFRRLQRRRSQLFIRRWRYAVAAAVVLTGVLAGLLRKPVNPVPEPGMAEVVPGSAKAYLILSTGEKVDLTRDKTMRTEQNGTVLEWDRSGEIRYRSQKDGKEQRLIHNRIEVPRGGEFLITLEDGTRVWLNAGTSLEYPVEFASSVREIRLQGEAYFEVAKDTLRPFIIRSGDYRLQVYGTEFNLNTYDSTRLLAVLVEGSIGFKANREAEERFLKPRQLGIANPENGESEIWDIDVYPYIAWKNNDMVFVNERLESIMQKVERWYDVEVVFGKSGLKELRFYGDIKRYADIRELLAFLEKTSRARFKIEGRTIVVTEK